MAGRVNSSQRKQILELLTGRVPTRRSLRGTPNMSYAVALDQNPS